MAEEGKGAEVKSEEAAAAPAKPRKKKGRFKERKKKAAVADLTELDHHPTFVDCFEYVDDEAAVLAEELLADGLAYVYRGAGAEYDGPIERWDRIEAMAKARGRGVWAAGAAAAETPAEYKRKLREKGAASSKAK